MRYGFAVAFALSMASAGPAMAGDYVQPAVFAKVAFGGKAAVSDFRVGFRADYADSIRRRLSTVAPDSPAAVAQPSLARLPALFEAEWSSTQIVVSENGLPIAGRSLALNETGEEKSGSNWGLNLGLALAATGAALALIINSAGHAAKENEQSVNAGPGGVSAGGDNGSGSNGGSGSGTCVGVGAPNEVCTGGG
jgi:hypothetical protein